MEQNMCKILVTNEKFDLCLSEDIWTYVVDLVGFKLESGEKLDGKIKGEKQIF